MESDDPSMSRRFQSRYDLPVFCAYRAIAMASIVGEFAVQTCYLGRYGQEMGSDQFGATIMASAEYTNTNDNERVILRLSNIEVRSP